MPVKLVTSPVKVVQAAKLWKHAIDKTHDYQSSGAESHSNDRGDDCLSSGHAGVTLNECKQATNKQNSIARLVETTPFELFSGKIFEK
ncbi:hypothetical protein AC1031_015068 [Aphanomyces cochlioides]|nr:hypothetical protein AC1031_015068 [Aphanomyces cochlioides]